MRKIFFPILVVFAGFSMMTSASFAAEQTVAPQYAQATDQPSIASILGQATSPPATTVKPKAVVVPASTNAATKVNSFGSTALSRSAFTKTLRNLMPLSPAQVRTLHDMFQHNLRTVAQYPGVPPKPTSSSLLVNMSPGAAPPTIRLRAGYVTSLVFLDSTGQPWPIVGYDLGDPKAFNIEPAAPSGKSDTLIIQSMSEFGAGNLAVMLKGQETPVMITLLTGQRAVDYRVDLRMPGLGPNAIVSMNGLPPSANPKLLTFLDGVPPQGAKILDVIGPPAQAWLYSGHLFLRTRVTLLSPGWISSMSSPDGTHVYELIKTPIVLASQRGAMVKIFIKGL